MDWRFFGVGIALTTVGVGIMAVDLAAKSHGASDDDDDDDDATAPRFPGFSAAATLQKLQGTWRIDDDNAVSIDGGSATRVGDPSYTNARLVVHSPCSYAVDHDESTYDVPFAMTPTGPRWDDTDGARLGTTTVICSGVHVSVITKGKCVAWNAILGDKWEREDEACSLTDEGGGKLSFMRDGGTTELVASGDALYPESAGEVTPVRYASFDAMKAAAAGDLQKQKDAIIAAHDPDTLVTAANQVGQDVAAGVEVTVKGYVDHVDEGWTFYVRTAKTASGDDAIVECDATGGDEHAGKPVTVSGTIESVDAGSVRLSPCGVPKKGHPG